MTEESNIIQLNPKKSSTLEFDVTISGLENTTPIVRFIIQNVKDNIDWVVNCKLIDGAKWQAAFPAFDNIKLDTCQFFVEVIVDEYYFKPASGKIVFINAPDISFKSKDIPKPSVTTSFVVKQEDDPIPEPAKVEIKKPTEKPKEVEKSKPKPDDTKRDISLKDYVFKEDPQNKNDGAISSILTELGITVTPKKIQRVPTSIKSMLK